MLLSNPPHTLVLIFHLFVYFLLFHCTKYRYICKQFIAKQAQILPLLVIIKNCVVSSLQHLTKLQFIVLLSILAIASC